ncbi:ankyrin repeat-containing domain protein [Aspergillus varians]
MLDESCLCDQSINAIIFAGKTGNLATLEKVLQYVTPGDEWVDSSCSRALMEASGSGHDHVLRFLFELGLSCDIEELVRLAAKGGHIKTVRALLDADADLSSQCDLSECPLTTTAMTYAIGDIRDLAMTVLHELARIGCLDMLHSFLNLGSPVDAQTTTGDTPLFWAIRHRHPSAVMLLPSRGASASMSNRAGDIPLHLVPWSYDLSTASAIVQLLVDYGADVNARSGTNEKPLRRAAFCGDDGNIVKILLQAGADCHAAVDGHSTTPLLIAMSTWSTRHLIIPLRIDVGRVESPEKDTRSIISWAVRHGLLELLKKLTGNSSDAGLRELLATLPLLDAVMCKPPPMYRLSYTSRLYIHRYLHLAK